MKLVALIVSAVVAIAACGPQPQTTKAVDPKSLPVEQKFMTVVEGHFVPADAPTVARAKTLIDRASTEYGISRDLIADQAYMASKIAKQDQISASAIEILEAATLMHTPGDGLDFAQACAIYLTVRKSGMPHAEALVGTRGLVHAVAKYAR